MADQKNEDFSNPSSGKILGLILKVLGGGVGALVVAAVGYNSYESWDFQKK